MRKLLTPILWLSICLLVLLPIVYGVIIYLFHQGLVLDKRKFAEEASKVFASFVLSVTSLGLSQLGEQMKIKRRAGALADNIKTRLRSEQGNMAALSTIRPPLPQGNKIEDLRVNKEFYEGIRDRIDSLTHVVNEVQQQLLRSEPEAISLCRSLANPLGQLMDSITLYSKTPSSDNLARFRQSLQALQGAIGQ